MQTSAARLVKYTHTALETLPAGYKQCVEKASANVEKRVSVCQRAILSCHTRVRFLVHKSHRG